MKILLIISIFVFCFLIGKINKKNLNNSLYIAIVAVFTPIVFLNQINTPTFIAFIFSLLFLLFFDLTTNKIFKKILFIITLTYFSFAILYLSGILNNRLEIDYQKLFIIDNSNFETIKKFQVNALYLPKILRPIIFNFFQIIFVFFVRTINYLWIDKLITFLGFTVIYLIYFAFTKKKNRYLLIFPILVVAMGILHRNPNNNLIFLFTLPSLVLFFIKNITKLNIPFLVTMILLSCLYSFI